MPPWPPFPTIYEINTWVWLHTLSQRYDRPVTLADVPDTEWDALQALGFDAIWLMGVWERSPLGREIARQHPDLQAEYRRALPDFTPEDVVGSPYAVHQYRAAPELGGPEGLAAARAALRARGLRLILDFVPNHVAVDHPWVTTHPEYFIQGTEQDLQTAPDAFFRAGGAIIAHGRDPYFPAWTDTAQLNAFHPALRQAAVDTLRTIGDQCDGVRVDMAMLMMTRIFEGTWGDRAGTPPTRDFWPLVIQAVKATHPDLLFIAEAYWDLEWDLQQQGFDYCYDKRLYDRVTHNSAPAINDHVHADQAFQHKLVRFLENHDEPRAAAILAPRNLQAAMLVVATLPGARLLHEGQLEGSRVRLPVQLGRRQHENTNAHLQAFYHTLLELLRHPVFHHGTWQLCERTGWPDNHTYEHLLAWCWEYEEERRLIVVNLSDTAAQARVKVPWTDLNTSMWALHDPFNGDRFLRYGNEMVDPGLYVGLGAYGTHFLIFEKSAPGS
ncbi:MAG: alpha-amylase family glycosyl hydrolase [Anaerolineae bacterium]